MSYVRESVLLSVMNEALPELAEIVGLPVKFKSQVVGEDSYAAGQYVTVTTTSNLDPRIVARFCLTDMPGCCGICISTGAMTGSTVRERGIGTLLMECRKKIAKGSGFGVLLCTDVQENPMQRKILATTGWKDIHQFINPRSGNRVNISVVNLSPEVNAK